MDKCPIHGTLLKQYGEVLICPEQECFYRFMPNPPKPKQAHQTMKKARTPYKATTNRKKVLKFQRQPLKKKEALSVINREQKGLEDFDEKIQG